jgi:hypothetical protein
MNVASMSQTSQRANQIRAAIPRSRLFTDKTWRIAPEPFPIPAKLHDEFVELGTKLHTFNKACNLLYRQSVKGKQPSWIHQYLDAGKPESLIEASRNSKFTNDVPSVIRPDILLTEEGYSITELDSVPGGIGLTAWLQEVYGQPNQVGTLFSQSLSAQGGSIAIVISEEAKDYRPETSWLSQTNSNLQPRTSKLFTCAPEELSYQDDGIYLRNERIHVVYRFFELFDLPNIANAEKLIASAKAGSVRVTSPFKPYLEEKLWFALFWFPQLKEFWRRELGDRYYRDLKKVIPFTWLLDPSPLPPHATIPQLEIHSWEELKKFSQKERDLILKISGFSEKAWGSRGVYVGSDMPTDEWAKVVQGALDDFSHHPHILQRFAKTRMVEHAWWNFDSEQLMPMKGRVRLCPYYFVIEDKPQLGGILATICPADKKLIHGMTDAIMTLATLKEEPEVSSQDAKAQRI